MNKHVRQMMIDLRLERQARHRDCTYRRMLLHRTYKLYAQLWRYWFHATTMYLNEVWRVYTYHRKYDGKTSLVRCTKSVNVRYQIRKHQCWALCNSMVEDTIRCAEMQRVSDPFDRREYVDLAIMELPRDSHN